MLHRILAFRHRLRDLGLAYLVVEQAWHSLPLFIAASAALLLVFASMLATAAATHSKAVNTEQRVNNLVTSTGGINTRVSNLSGQSTSTNGLANGLINGHTDTAGLTDGTIGGSTGQINTGGGTAHTHGSGSLAVRNGQHEHGAHATDGTLAVNDGTHHHTLPSV
jgi:hypothetical protein